MRILLLGPPASGKGTIGRLLGRHLNIPVLSVGKYLRGIPKDAEYYELVNDIMRKGDLVPNNILGGLLTQETKHPRYENGIVIEGWMRQVSDLEHFDSRPDHVVVLNISKETSKNRILQRRVCEKEGHTYNLVFNPPKIEGVCDIDGSKLILREDDNEKTLEKRWKIHEESTVVSIEHYRKQGKVVEVSAETTPEDIFKKIKEKLNI